MMLLLVWSVFASSWQDFQSIDGRFSIKSPHALDKVAKVISTAVGDLEYHNYFWSCDHDSLGYGHFVVSYCDYPTGAFPADSVGLVDLFFDASSEQAATAVDGELIYEDDIMLGSYPGRFWRIHYNEGETVVKTRAFLVGDRYYSVQVAVLAASAQEAFVDRFLKSFKILE
ncbi:MAG: hypothetical protein KTR24_06235 [Saprospiraceae bacterium]|nr:hypothetical protein [Saprospiraceae bacterium]